MIKKKPKSTVTCIAWHPNNQLLAVGSLDYRVRIYSAYVNVVDGQPQTSGWGKITNTGDLLHELQTGKIRFFDGEKLFFDGEFRTGMGS